MNYKMDKNVSLGMKFHCPKLVVRTIRELISFSNHFVFSFFLSMNLRTTLGIGEDRYEASFAFVGPGNDRRLFNLQLLAWILLPPGG